jgi:hypothetical protein
LSKISSFTKPEGVAGLGRSLQQASGARASKKKFVTDKPNEHIIMSKKKGRPLLHFISFRILLYVHIPF